jgi:predicted DNA-binding protein (MmcQ/YjbR family)
MDLDKAAEKLRKLALAYPETYEEQPWGDRVVKVRGKIFLFAGVHDGKLHVTVKLPQSRREVLAESFAKPTGYGLGKSGWVSSTFGKGDKVPEARIVEWIAESYRALAPKKLVAQVEASGAKKPAAPAVKKLKKRVMLLCHDPLRAERCQAMCAERGVAVETTAKVAEVRKRLAKLDAVIVDLGRLQDEGLALAGEIDASDHEVHLFIVGIRDAAARKRAQDAATSAELFKSPPGDPTVADAVRATLARYA